MSSRFPGSAIAVLGFLLVAGSGSAQPSPQLDHFQCYRAKGRDLDVTVSLADEFGVKPTTRLDDPRLFCNPVDKNEEGIADPTAHLACYEIRNKNRSVDDDDDDRRRRKQFLREVLVTNQFGEQTLKVDEGELLCTPSEKNGVASELLLDHFKCYHADGDLSVTVDLEDQWGASPQTHVGDPRLFCNPADKNGEGILDPTGHLTCYEIRPAAQCLQEDDDGERRRRLPWRKVLVENQFGRQYLKVTQAKLLCVPSETAYGTGSLGQNGTLAPLLALAGCLVVTAGPLRRRRH
jgi:hypothetical protein